MFLGHRDNVRGSTKYPSWPISGCKQLKSRFVNREGCIAGLCADFKHRKRTDAPDTAVLELVVDFDIDLKRVWSW